MAARRSCRDRFSFRYTARARSRGSPVVWDGTGLSPEPATSRFARRTRSCRSATTSRRRSRKASTGSWMPSPRLRRAASRLAPTSHGCARGAATRCMTARIVGDEYAQLPCSAATMRTGSREVPLARQNRELTNDAAARLRCDPREQSRSSKFRRTAKSRYWSRVRHLVRGREPATSCDHLHAQSGQPNAGAYVAHLGSRRAIRFDKARWIELRDRLGEVAISTIDAFCFRCWGFPWKRTSNPGSRWRWTRFAPHRGGADRAR